MEEDIERVYGHDREDSLYDGAVMKCMSKAAAKGLTFNSCKVSIHVTSSYDDEKIAEAQLTETVAIDYGEFSASAGQISHVFTFTPSGDEYLIKTHKCSSDFYDMLKKAVSAEADSSGHKINELTYSYLEKYIDAAVEKLSGKIQKNEQENEVPAAKPEFEYDRNAAVHYANSWASTAAEVRNRSMYSVYEENS